jgi:geranylgeranyl diphosphate synthase type II
MLALQRYHGQIEAALHDAVQGLGEDTRLREACGYALLSGGKRLRPAIVLMVADALGAKHSVIRAALATEFFHTASLIADDLPCMDDAPLRRAQPTLHRRFGQDVALLATYALIAEGYQYIAENVEELKCRAPGKPWDEIGIRALQNATRNTGIRGATGGQYIDLHPPEKASGALVRQLIHMKTTTLFEISFVLGWLFGGGNPAELPRVTELSHQFGLAYQIADDLDDLDEDTRQGRPFNYALAFGLDAARQQLRDSVATCETLSEGLGLRVGALLEISSSLREMADAA